MMLKIDRVIISKYHNCTMRKSSKHLAKALHLIRLYRERLAVQTVRLCFIPVIPTHFVDLTQRMLNSVVLPPLVVLDVHWNNATTHVRTSSSLTISLYTILHETCCFPYNFTIYTAYSNYSFPSIGRYICDFSCGKSKRRHKYHAFRLILSSQHAQLIYRCFPFVWNREGREIGFTINFTVTYAYPQTRHQWSIWGVRTHRQFIAFLFFICRFYDF